MQIFHRGQLLTPEQLQAIAPKLPVALQDNITVAQRDNIIDLALIEAGCPVPPSPVETGVGDLCAPGPADKQAPAYILRFEDHDRPDMAIFDPDQARAAFARAELLGWNCHLFELAKRGNPVTFQQRVCPWLIECFGAAISTDTTERNHRFLEEAVELAQSCGCSASEAHQLVDYVFGRPKGEPTQEVGGVMVTLAALCLAHGMDMHQSAELELARIWDKVEQIRAKQQRKPSMSPLPGASV